MKKSPALIACILALCTAMTSVAYCAEGRPTAKTAPDRHAAGTAEQADKDSATTQKNNTGMDSKLSSQGLERAQKAEANKKLLEKQGAENRARENARAKHKDVCKGCPDGHVFDQSFIFNR